MSAYLGNRFCSTDMHFYTAAWQVGLVEVKLRRQSVGQSVLVSGAHLGLATNFSFSLKFSFDSCEFVIL
jgi:hypothetical protein